jgi:hypothetical protein
MIDTTLKVREHYSATGLTAQIKPALATAELASIDLSTSFIDAANYLTTRCGLSRRVTFRVAMLYVCLLMTRLSMWHSCST